MPLYFSYTMVHKSQKWPKTQIKGGSCLKGKLHSKIISSDLINFSIESDGEGPTSKFKQEDGQTHSDKKKKKTARASVCDVSGTTLQSWKVVRAIRNVRDKPELICTRPAVVNLP